MQPTLTQQLWEALQEAPSPSSSTLPGSPADQANKLKGQPARAQTTSQDRGLTMLL